MKNETAHLIRCAGTILWGIVDEVPQQPAELIIPEMVFDIVDAERRAPFEDVRGIAFCIIQDGKGVRLACETKHVYLGDMTDGIMDIGMIADIVEDFSTGSGGEQDDNDREKEELHDE